MIRTIVSMVEPNPEITREPPRTSRGAERRAMLFDVATELFLKFGYDNVSLDQIVEHAGGSKATIYKYFGSKQGLFLAIYQDRSHKFIHQIQVAVRQEDIDIQTLLNHLLFDLYTIVSDPESSGLWRLIIQISQNDPALSQRLYNLGPAQAHEIFADFLTQAHHRNEIICPLPTESAIYFFGFLHDLHWRALVGLPLLDEETDIRARIKYIVDLFLRGHQKP